MAWCANLVAGLVEKPCQKRNARRGNGAGERSDLACSTQPVGFDQTVEAM